MEIGTSSLEESLKKVGISQEDVKECMSKVVLPTHSKNCKKCLGTKRIGFRIDPKTKKRIDTIFCPIYLREVDQAVSQAVSNWKAKKEIKDRNPKSFDEMITG